jgi:hypothetical protein
MKFCNYESSYDLWPRKELCIDEHYEKLINHSINKRGITGELNLYQSEYWWIKRNRPYFKLWPSLVQNLTKLKLDIYSDLVPMPPVLPIVIRFQEYGVSMFPETASILLDIVRVNPLELAFPAGSRTLVVCSRHISDQKLSETVHAVLRPGETVEECLNIEKFPQCNLDYVGNKIKNSDILEFDNIDYLKIKLALSLCLLANDPSIIKPDVLAADRERFDNTNDEELKKRLIEKARKRGIVGWRIGESYETIPHFRRPHVALRWTKKGRTVPRIVPIKGAVVHRQKLTEVPTGYMTPEGEEIEQ